MGSPGLVGAAAFPARGRTAGVSRSPAELHRASLDTRRTAAYFTITPGKNSDHATGIMEMLPCLLESFWHRDDAKQL